MVCLLPWPWLSPMPAGWVRVCLLGTTPTVPCAGGRSRETLRTRFNKYAASTRPLVGPTSEHKKMWLFAQLQQRGFTMWYRCGPRARREGGRGAQA